MVIAPPNIEQYNIFQFSRYKELIEVGYEAALDRIPELLEIIDTARKEKKKAAEMKKGKKGKGK